MAMKCCVLRACLRVITATHNNGSTMHSSVDVRQMILLPSSRSATTQTPSTGDRGLQRKTQYLQVWLVKRSTFQFTSWPGHNNRQRVSTTYDLTLSTKLRILHGSMCRPIAEHKL